LAGILEKPGAGWRILKGNRRETAVNARNSEEIAPEK